MRDHADFGSTLEAAAALLRQLPRGYEDVREAQRRVMGWGARHQGAEAQLLVDHQPGTPEVEYDLLLRHPDGGMVALTWLEDGGLPWAVYYGDHWAANYVLTIDGEHRLTVQQALMQLRMAARTSPDLMESMVNHLILAQHAGDDALAPSEDELQAAADAFRQARGLRSAADTVRWLDEIRLPQAYFEAMLEMAVRIRKVKQRIAAGRVDAYFAAHHAEFDNVRLCEVRTPDRATAERLAAWAEDSGLLAALDEQLRRPGTAPLDGQVTTRRAAELAPELRDAAPGAIVGPYADGAQWVVAQIAGRQAAQLDEQARLAVEEAVCREWLAEQRATADIRWHWL